MLRLLFQLLCLMLLLIPACFAAGPYAYKYLSGPPDQFPRFYPEYFPINSDLLLLPLSSISTNSSGEYMPFPVDNSSKMFVSVLLPITKHSKWIMKRVSVYFRTPSGYPVVSLSVAQEIVSVSDNFKYLCKSYTISNPKVGTWEVKVTLRKSLLSNFRKIESYPVYVLVGYDGSQIILESQIASVQRFTVVNRPVFINVNVTMPSYDGQTQLRPKLTMFQSNLAVIQPDGISYEEEINMDTFQLSKSGRNELQLTGAFIPPIGGLYMVQVNVSGETQSGMKFARTQWHLVGVSSNRLFYKEFNTFTLSNGYFRIEMHISWQEGMDLTYRVFSEVWGVVDGDLVPICWVIHLTDIERNSTGSYFLPIYIHSNWILQYTIPPDTLFLRNVSIDDVNLFTTILEVRIMKVDLTNPSFDYISASILYRTRNNCKRKAKKDKDVIEYSTDQPNLLLVHGYCAKENPFTLENFTNYIVFEDWDQSLSNDQFARHIIDFTKERNLSAFSIVAHSQGGLASVHLYAYYESGLDSYSVSGDGGDRKIQTVGSPYLGTPLAGLLADIGHFFGIMCGSNLELTYEGAQAWISKVPLEVQYDVHFYRTFYGKRKKYCNFGTNVVLKGPNDGLVEVGKARLPFGRGEGISPGECHSANMQWPSQCKNPRRNAEMNRNAARP